MTPSTTTPEADPSVSPHAPETPADAAPRPSVPRRAWDRLTSLRLATVKDVTQVILGVAVFAWGIYTFVYKEIVLPARRPASLVITPSLERIGRRGEMEMIRAVFVLSNPSPSRVYVPAAWYGVHGIRFATLADNPDTVYVPFNRRVADRLPATTRFSYAAADDVVGVGRLIQSLETWYEPGEQGRMEEVLLVPAGRYDALRVDVRFFVTKDVKEMVPVRWSVDSTGALTPYLARKRWGYRFDSTRVTDLNDLSDDRDWMDENTAGHGSAVAFLSLWEREGGPRQEVPAVR